MSVYYPVKHIFRDGAIAGFAFLVGRILYASGYSTSGMYWLVEKRVKFCYKSELYRRAEYEPLLC